MLWLWGILCALALVVLFFPFVFWIDFEASLNGARACFRLFKKPLYTYTKTFEKKHDSTIEESSTASEAAPAEHKSAPKAAETSADSAKTNSDAPKIEAPSDDNIKDSESIREKETEKQDELATPTDNEDTDGKNEPHNEDRKKEKRSLTSQEFWTLLLTPEFDSRAWWAVKGIFSALFKLFRVRFIDCFVEGIRADYDTMGYWASANAFLKNFPYIGAWDFRMDWTYDNEPRAQGQIRASVNVCRILGLTLATLFFGGIVALSFWRRRSHMLKTGEIPELGFIRNKIVKIMSEDD